MKKFLFPILMLLLCISFGYAREFDESGTVASKEIHRNFINTYRARIQAKTAQKNIPFGIVAAIMSSQSGGHTIVSGNNFSRISAKSLYAKVGKFEFANHKDGLMIFDRPRHNAEATILVLSGWLKTKGGTYPKNSEEWINALIDAETGLFSAERLSELVLAYEVATNKTVNIGRTRLKTTTDQQKNTSITSTQTKEQSQQLTNKLAETKAALDLKEQKLQSLEQEKEAIQKELEEIKEELSIIIIEKDSAQEELISMKYETIALSKPNNSLISMLDIKGGMTFFKEEGLDEVSNGINLEIQYSLVSASGIGLELGVDLIKHSEFEQFAPYINPFFGISFGKYDGNIGFSLAPRVYYFTNPTLELETDRDNRTTITHVRPSLMYGGVANLYFKIGKITALTLYGSYRRGSLKLEEQGIESASDYLNMSQNNVSIIGTGLGLSFKL